jgi:uncharacterized protein YoxC
MIDDTAIAQWRFLFDVIQFVALVGVWVYAVMTRKSDANTKILDKHSARLELVEKDLVRIDKHLETAPSHEDLQRIHDRISEVKTGLGGVQASVSGLTESTKAVRSSLDLIQRKVFSESGDD